MTGCHGIAINGNTIYSCDGHNVLLEDSDQINLTGNVMRRHTDNLGTGIRFVRSKNCIINSCVVEDESPDGQTSGHSTLELEDCSRINISGSQFLSGVPYCIDVRDCNYINIDGCTLADVRSNRASKAAIRWLGSGQGNTMSSNILGPVAVGAQVVEIADESNVTVADSNTLVLEPR